MGKITTRADDIDEAKKNDPKYEIFENYDMKVRVHGDTAVVTGKTRTKKNLRRETVRFPVSIYRYIGQRRRALAFTRRPCLKAADERKVRSA